jgi:hypothetical protein
MKNIILLVQSQEDAAQLAKLGKVIGKLAPVGLWVLYSPVITFDAAKVTAQFDEGIAELEKAEKKAALAGDYETAKTRKNDRELLLTNRSVAIRNGWKGVSAEDRKAGSDRYLLPFLKDANPKNERREGWRISMMAEHQEPEHWIAALNELKGSWHTHMKPGHFVVMWPGELTEGFTTVSTSAFPPDSTVSAALPQRLPVNRVPVDNSPLTPTGEREAELTGMHFKTLQALAKKLGIAVEGLAREELVKAVIAAEELAAMS